MSIITTVEAVPSRLFAIYDSLFDSEHGVVKEQLEAWATPPSLRSRGADTDAERSTMLFKNPLQEARKIGLVEEIDKRLHLTAESRGGGKKGEDSERLFRGYMMNTLFDPARAEETQQSAFMLALTWFLNTDPRKPPNFSKGPQTALKTAIGEHAGKTELTSISPYQNLLYWARYLGFATIVGTGRAKEPGPLHALPDPIRAIDSVLPTIFDDGVELTIEQFLSRLAAIFPVFETGTVRKAYDAMLSKPPTDAAQRLSIATSIALQRLADRQRVQLDREADAPARLLDFGGRDKRVSHVSLKEVA